MISLIWAMDKNWLIGVDNKLPWRYKEDLAYFKEQTENRAVLMGDNTYHSMKYYYKDRPLPYSPIYVASRNPENVYKDATRVANLDEFLQTYEGDLWVIGGSVIFDLSIPYADRLYITWIDKEHKGDKYFKKFDLENKFKLISEKQGKTKELRFCIYEKV